MRHSIPPVFLVVCLASGVLQAQNYNHPGGTIATCSGNYFDPGGATGSYSNSTDITTTFCPATAGDCITFAFTSFDLESNYDFLEIYDGPTTSYPLIGSYSGTTSPGTITASHGCLTFVFTSDFSVTHSGWRATLSCITCPPPPPCTGVTPSCASIPDDCSTACHLGTLTAPPACPSSNSSVNVFCLSNIGATPSTPYLYLNGCQPSGGSMASPAADVWYSFVASSNIIDVTLTGLNDANIGLYEGNNCNTFIGRGCAVGAFGNLNATFQPMMPGHKYYLQISGGDTTDTGNITLTISNRNDCDPCVINASLTASPLPTSGIYRAGTTVHFCLTLTQWRPTSVNWLHAIVPTFGECWDMSSLVVYPPPSCDGNGSWGWYNSVTSSQTGVVTGPGFFYESTLGCGVCNPNNPGDNYGDNCTGSVNFVFCWDITVAQCVTGNSLNVSVNTFGDGETGSWTSYACAADPIFDFFAIYTRCSDPHLQLQGVTCNGGANGQAIVQGQGTPPYDFVWRDNPGNVLRTTLGRSDNDTLKGLPAGDYTVQQLDAGLCDNTVPFTIDQPSPLAVNLNVSNVSCAGLNNGSIDISASGGIVPYEYSIDGTNFQSSNSFTSLDSGAFTISVRDDSSCMASQNASVTEPVQLAIVADSIINSSCAFSSNGAIYISTSGGTIPHTFNWSNTVVTEDITGLSGGNYSLSVSDLNGCNATDTFTVAIGAGISLSATVTDVRCNGGSDGSVDLTVANAIIPIVYSWSTNTSSEDLIGVPAGIYSVTAVDANQCPDTATYTITEPPAISLRGITTNLLCHTDYSGAIDLTASGGVLPFSFVWSNNAITEDITGVAVGNYSVVATDSNSCTDTISFMLTEPDSIELSYVKTDVLCAGGNDGAIDLSLIGGTLPYQFTWSNNATTEDLMGLTATTYDVVVIDSHSCTATTSVTIVEPVRLTVSGVTANVLCNSGNTGAIDISVNGGTTPYNYLWSNSLTSEDLIDIAAESYTLTVTDAHQCADTSAYVIAEPSAITLSGITSNLLCHADYSGAIDLSAYGGTQPFAFIWSNNAIIEDITGVAAGNYSVIATDSNSCTATILFALTEPDSIELSSVKTNVLCAGGDNGAIDLTIIGGTLPYQFTWSNNATTEDLTGLTAMAYDVVVLDSHSCTATTSVTIVEPAQLIISGVTTDVLCNAGNSGAIDISVNGGTIPYDYLWSNSLTSEDLTDVVAGNYTLTVTDTHQCADTSAYVITEPFAITLSGITSNLLCHADNSGAIDLTTLGGVPPFVFAWSNNAITEDITGVAAGNYSIIATDSNFCTATISFTLTETDSIELSSVKTDVLCAGGNTGAIDLSVIGGTLPYQFIWSNNATTQDLIGLTAMTYDLVVIDSHSCTETISVTINEPSVLLVSGSETDVLCNGANTGAIDITASGGVLPYGYQWSNSLTSEDLVDVTANNYSLTVTDANQCSDTSTFVITEPPAIVLTGVTTDLLCQVNNSGAIDLTTSGGISPFSFLWSNNSTDEDLSGLAPGNYSVIATDSNSCTATTSFTLTQPNSTTLTYAKTDVSCFGGNDGAIDVTMIGGSLPVQYTWSNNATTEDLNGLTAATYDVVAVDFNTCTATASVTINEPVALSVIGNTVDVLCNGGNTGAVNITVSGGTTPYSYQWSNLLTSEDLTAVTANNYSVTVFDANQCTAESSFIVDEPVVLNLAGSVTDVKCSTSSDGIIQLSASGGIAPYQYSLDGVQFQSLPTFNNVPGGNYQPETQDANGCPDTIHLIVNIPPPIVTSITTDSVKCFNGNDGAATVIAIGVNGPFTYAWSNNSTSTAASNLIAGTYFVTINDNNNCLAYDTADIFQPLEMVLLSDVTDVLCHGVNTGSIELSVSGGIPGYGFAWSNNQITQNIYSLNAGNYSVTVTDNNNCVETANYSTSEPSALTIVINSTPVICNGDGNGVATASSSGGIAPYTYLWDAAASNQTTSSAINLSAGDYGVVVTDAHNCTTAQNAVITEPPPMTVVIDTSADPRCNGESTGFVHAISSGGTAPIAFLWSDTPPSHGNLLTGVPAGTYNITTTDGNGCSAAASITLDDPPPLTVSIFPNDTTIAYGDSVQLHAVHSPALATPTYLWEPAGSISWCVSPCVEPIAFPSSPTTFTVYLSTDGGNCTATAQAFVNVEYTDAIHAPNAFTPDGDGVNDEFEIFFSPALTGINYKIFNRWGEKLFESATIGDFWDGNYRGKPQNPGVYVYWVEAGFLDGEKKQYKGSLTLLK